MLSYSPSLLDIGIFADPVMLAYAAEIELDDWQKDYVRSEDKRILLNCCRQSGKSTAVAVRIVWEAINRPKWRTLIVCPGQRQSSETFEKVLDIYRATGKRVAPIHENLESLRLFNGSRIVALPGVAQTIRGFSKINRLAFDEGAWITDELAATVRPMLAVSDGSIVAPSTPWGKRGWWYEAWTKGIEWRKYEVPWQLCPRIKPEYIAEERRNVGDDWVAQEYECKFLEAARSAFRAEDINAVLDSGVTAWSL